MHYGHCATIGPRSNVLISNRTYLGSDMLDRGLGLRPLQLVSISNAVIQQASAPMQYQWAGLSFTLTSFAAASASAALSAVLSSSSKSVHGVVVSMCVRKPGGGS